MREARASNGHLREPFTQFANVTTKWTLKSKFRNLMTLFCIDESSHFPLSQQEFRYHCVGILSPLRKKPRIYVGLPYIARYQQPYIELRFPPAYQYVSLSEFNNTYSFKSLFKLLKSIQISCSHPYNFMILTPIQLYDPHTHTTL